MAKAVHCQVQVAGATIFDETVPAKKDQRALMLKAMAAVDAHGGAAVIRVQTIGAKKWGRWRYAAGGKAAELDPSAPWAE